MDSTIMYEFEKLPRVLRDLDIEAISILRKQSLTIPFWNFPHAGIMPEATAGGASVYY